MFSKYFLVAASATLIGLAGVSGCAHHKKCHGNFACGTGYGCYGYNSTCWRPWPAECPPCPSFAIIPPEYEEVVHDRPFNQETLPGPKGLPRPVQEPTAPMPNALPVPPNTTSR